MIDLQARARDLGGGFFPVPHPPPNPAGSGSKLTLTGFESGTAHYDQRGLQKPMPTFNDLTPI